MFLFVRIELCTKKNRSTSSIEVVDVKWQINHRARLCSLFIYTTMQGENGTKKINEVVHVANVY